MSETSRRSPVPLSRALSMVARLLLGVAALPLGAEAATTVDAVSLSGVRVYSTPGRTPTYDTYEYDETGFLNTNNDPFESRTIVEFPSAAIPATALAFHLRSSFGGYCCSLPKSIDIYAYAGDGVASVLDFDVGNRVGSAVLSDLGEFSVAIDPASIESIRATSPFVGFSVRSAGTQGPPGYVDILYMDAPVVLDVLADQPPVANAGADQSFRVGQTVNLDGRASYDDNTSPQNLRYHWRFTYRPAGSTATIVGADSATASFVADVADHYTVELVVTDSANQTSAPDAVDATGNTNLPPVANAGADQLIVVGNFVQLDGNGTLDPENDPITSVRWSLAKPAGSAASLYLADSYVPSFTPDVVGVYTATLTASDLFGPGTPDSAVITVVSATNYVERRVAEAAELINRLPAASVTSPGNRAALINLLAQIVDAGRRGDTATQLRKVEDAISRTDGCWVYGAREVTGSSMDWIIPCDVQIAVYTPLRSAWYALAFPIL